MDFKYGEHAAWRSALCCECGYCHWPSSKENGECIKHQHDSFNSDDYACPDFVSRMKTFECAVCLIDVFADQDELVVDFHWRRAKNGSGFICRDCATPENSW